MAHIQKHSEGPHANPTDCTMCTTGGHPKMKSHSTSSRPQTVADTDSDGY